MTTYRDYLTEEAAEEAGYDSLEEYIEAWDEYEESERSFPTTSTSFNKLMTFRSDCMDWANNSGAGDEIADLLLERFEDALPPGWGVWEDTCELVYPYHCPDLPDNIIEEIWDDTTNAIDDPECEEIVNKYEEMGDEEAEIGE